VGGSLLNLCQSGDVSTLKGRAADRKVLDRTLGLGAVQGVCGYFNLTHGVVFDAVFHVETFRN
jgi:hypothetical protein